MAQAPVHLRSRVLCQGMLEHKGNGSSGQWKTLWFILRENIIYIYEDKSARDEKHVGCLTLDESSRFNIERGNKNEYKFELTTQGPRTNRFKTKKKSEREKWRSYITGISKGTLPNDIDLLDSEIERIQSDVDQLKNNGNISRQSRLSDESGIGPDTISNASGSGGSGTLHGGGPTMRHNFYQNDHITGAPRVPSWFFANCPRPLAEAALVAGQQYGNALMRESTTFSQSGSYVISKRMDRKDQEPTFEHYEVIRTAKGYKVKVENEHEAMKCLSDVMTYFMKTSGISETSPMTTNNLVELGLDVPDYATRIPHTQPAAPWAWPPGSNQPPAVIANNYDGAVPGEAARRETMFGSQTVNPAILNREQERFPSAFGQHHTVTGSRKQPANVTMNEIAIRHEEQAGIARLEEAISSFEDPIYQNDDSARDVHGRQQESWPSSPPPPPPPTAHRQTFSPGYVNEEPVQLESAVFSLPPAPPPPVLKQTPQSIMPPPPPPPTVALPKTPQVAPSSSASVNPLYHKGAQLQQIMGQLPPPVAPKPVKLDGTEGLLSIPAISSNPDCPSSPASPTNTLATLPFAPPPPKELPSATALSTMGQRPVGDNKALRPNSVLKPSLAHSQSFPTPDTRPEWMKNLKRQSKVHVDVPPPLYVDTPTKKTEHLLAGVDESRPGGVNTIRSKFNQRTTVNPSKDVQPEISLANVGRQGIQNIFKSKWTPTTDDVYEAIPGEEVVVLRGSQSNQSASRLTHSCSFPTFQADHRQRTHSFGTSQAVAASTNPTNFTNTSNDIYDDTVTPRGASPDIRQVHFQGVPRERRVTLPSLTVQTEQVTGTTEPTGSNPLSPDFKQRLEMLVLGAAGAKNRPSAPSAGLTEDHLYQDIPADEIFYANEQFNNKK